MVLMYFSLLTLQVRVIDLLKKTKKLKDLKQLLMSPVKDRH